LGLLQPFLAKYPYKRVDLYTNEFKNWEFEKEIS